MSVYADRQTDGQVTYIIDAYWNRESSKKNQPSIFNSSIENRISPSPLKI